MGSLKEIYSNNAVQRAGSIMLSDVETYYTHKYLSRVEDVLFSYDTDHIRPDVYSHNSESCGESISSLGSY